MCDLIQQIEQGEFDNCSLISLIRLVNYLRYKENYQVKVKFSSVIALQHTDSEIHKVQVEQNADKVQIFVTANFLGIVGSTGILPSHYTELLISSFKHKDSSLQNFLDIFYNKIVKLFVKIIQHNNLYLEYEKFLLTNKNALEHNWFSVVNFDGISSKIAAKTIPNILLKYTGLLATSSRPLAVLETILFNYLRHPLLIEQFVTERVKIADDELSKLGKLNVRLGNSLYLGDHAYFYQNKVIIKVFQLHIEQYQLLFSKESQIRKTLDLILDFYLGRNIKYQLTFILIEAERKAWLTHKKEQRLGNNMWLKVS
jgi:type VI secretion system protein ImpH